MQEEALAYRGTNSSLKGIFTLQKCLHFKLVYLSWLAPENPGDCSLVWALRKVPYTFTGLPYF